MNYKALIRYFDLDGKEVVKVCGFGEVKDFQEARETYSPRAEIVEISDTELKELRQSYGFSTAD
jgi:hypothetical protein